MALIIANHPPAVTLGTHMGEAALPFPGLRDVDFMRLIDDLLLTRNPDVPISSKSSGL